MLTTQLNSLLIYTIITYLQPSLSLGILSLFPSVSLSQKHQIRHILQVNCVNSSQTKSYLQNYGGLKDSQLVVSVFRMCFGHKEQASLVKKLCDSFHAVIKLQMFEQLKLLLQKQSLKQQQNQGRALDCLKQITYFKKLDSNLGSEYLLALLFALHPLVLRQGLTLIGQNDLYVHVQGDLRFQQAKFGGNRNVSPGIAIDLKVNHSLKYLAFSDCNLIRVQRTVGTMSNAQKRLQQLQKQHNKKFKEYQKFVIQLQHHTKLDIISKSSFFSTLGQYDRYEFALGCNAKQYSQNMLTHQKASSFNKIGYIASGRIKMRFINSQGNKKSQGIYWFLKQGDWIGLEEYLWNRSQQCSGEVQTIAALILWIPYQLFQAKFNIRTNCQTINKLIGLIKTKRLIFERSLTCRRRKLQETEVQCNSKMQLNSQLQAKVEALQPQPNKKKTYFSRNRLVSNKKRQVTYPEQILHKTQLLSDQPFNLPRLQSKSIVLFPEEYANSPVNPTYQKEMNRIKAIINKSQVKEHYSTIDYNPQAIYSAIYQQIPFKFQPWTTLVQQNPQKKYIEGKTIQHHNSSIYYNFKARKPRTDSSLTKTKTLTILTSNED